MMKILVLKLYYTRTFVHLYVNYTEIIFFIE